MSQSNLIEQPLHRSEYGLTAHSTKAAGQVPRFGTEVVGLSPFRSFQDDRFVCPGESHPISHSVHLARLSSGYPSCRHCQHKSDQGASSPLLQINLPGESRDAQSLVTADGIRAIYLNELDRTTAIEWGAAFGSMMWDAQPRHANPYHAKSTGIAVAKADSATQTTEGLTTGSENIGSSDGAALHALVNSKRRGPAVVIGFDERPSSPDIVLGIALGLRRMGCQVIDLGQTSSPCFHFAIHHLNAAGGIFVTGAGCDPAWTGLNFAGRDALPWVRSSTLQELASRAAKHVARPTRAAGSQRSFHALVPYEAGLWKLFHALRPLQIVCGVATRLLPRTLESLFARLPCRLTFETLPVRHRSFDDPQDPDVRRVAAKVLEGRQHLGFIVDDDGERCAFVTDTGKLVTAAELAQLLIRMELREHRSARFIVDQALFDQMSDRQSIQGWMNQTDVCSPAELPAKVIDREARLGLSSHHRVWVGDGYAACSAIQTLARVLQALSLSDATMTEVLAHTLKQST